MRIRFMQERIVDDARKGTPDEERYEEGQVYDLPLPSALRWISRNAAKPVEEDDVDEPDDKPDKTESDADPAKPKKPGTAKPRAKPKG